LIQSALPSTSQSRCFNTPDISDVVALLSLAAIVEWLQAFGLSAVQQGPAQV
jgi:hypothetical protein